MEKQRYLGLKLLTISLTIALLLYSYHKREWFLSIPMHTPLNSSIAGVGKKKQVAPIPLPSENSKARTNLFARFKAVISPASEALPNERDPAYLSGLLDTMYIVLGAEKRSIKRRTVSNPLSITEDQATIPPIRPMPEVVAYFRRIIGRRGVALTNCFENLKDSSIVMEFVGKSGLLRRIKLTKGKNQSANTRVAILIENIGLDLIPDLQKLFTIQNSTLVIGIVPLSPNATFYQALALKNDFEVITMLPMESVPYRNIGPEAIYKHTTTEQLAAILQKFDENLNGSSGYSIYGGGIRILESEPQILKRIFGHIKENGKFFVENSQSQRSKAYTFARELSIDYMRTAMSIESNRTTIGLDSDIEKVLLLIKKKGYGIISIQNPAHAAEIIHPLLNKIADANIRTTTISSLFIN